MPIRKANRATLTASSAAAALMVFAQPGPAIAQEATYNFDIPAQDISAALIAYGRASRQQLVFDGKSVANKKSAPLVGDYSAEEGLTRLLTGTGLRAEFAGAGAVRIVPDTQGPQSGSAAGAGAEVEALIVTAQKREEDIQDVPIAISAFTQEDLTRSQVAGGPDLMTQVPNFTFTKTNFSGYSIQIRGIGTQAISATTDAAVAVAFNNTPFIRNRFFEQEFFDLERVEVLRGPQGTLYGRNATAGVVNLISAKPKFHYEAKLSADVANYNSRRLEGMINIPLVDDIVALRLAGAWTKRDGYAINELTGQPIDGRDLWSGRASLRVEPTDRVSANLIYEHFEEDDDRLRSGKQLCHKDPSRIQFGDSVLPPNEQFGGTFGALSYTTQGCRAASLYAPESFETPNGFGLPYYGPTANLGGAVFPHVDPYVSATQSRDLRVIESMLTPEYTASTDIVEFQVNIDLAPSITLTSETSYLADEIFSFEDFNRFNTKPGAFDVATGTGQYPGLFTPDGVFCDPQLGCSDRLVAGDLSTARSHQYSQEFRVSSDFSGPFNFSLGANYLRYDTEDKFYVFINNLSAMAAYSWGRGNRPYVAGVSDSADCLRNFREGSTEQSYTVEACIYMDPNGIHNLNDLGHNYFLSRNPYRLISYALFGESYYQVTPDLKLTAGLRWTVDKKHAPQIPSWLLAGLSYGYPTRKVIDLEWREPTGRLAIDWKPALSFTDETLLYASYAHGYKAGGSNPPPAILTGAIPFTGEILEASLTHPETFDPEFVDAFELGAKNMLLDGKLTLNGNLFYYDYQGYQISQIVDRAAVNLNFDAEVWGAEIEASWRPLDNLQLGFKGGYENTRVADGSRAIDLMDRTAGDPNYVVVKPFPTTSSNCIFPVEYLELLASEPDWLGGTLATSSVAGACLSAYKLGLDPITGLPYVPDPEVDENGNPIQFPNYPGFNPATVPNNGEGIAKDLSGNQLPNAPKFTATVTADYTMPLANDWLMTLHTDLYYQSESWTRIFNMEGYDKLKAYTNVNLAAIFANEDAGWKVMAYVKNVFDRDSITGAFLNSDDTGLTTNVFLTEPRLYGLRITKTWSEMGWRPLGAGGEGPFAWALELGGGVQRTDAPNEVFRPGFVEDFTSPGLPFPLWAQDEALDWGDSREIRITYARPGARWWASAGASTSSSNGGTRIYDEEQTPGGYALSDGPKYAPIKHYDKYIPGPINYGRIEVHDREEHAIADFMVGREVGLGSLGAARVGAGLQYGQFKSGSDMTFWGTASHEGTPPELVIKYQVDVIGHRTWFSAEREFEGVGPALALDLSRDLFEAGDAGRVSVEVGLKGSVLFGKQEARTGYEEEVRTSSYLWVTGTTLLTEPDSIVRGTRVERVDRESATVPVLGASLGLAYEIGRVKVSGGYRAERFYNVLDGGVTEARSYDRTIDGPYFKIAIGFGG